MKLIHKVRKEGKAAYKGNSRDKGIGSTKGKKDAILPLSWPVDLIPPTRHELRPCESHWRQWFQRKSDHFDIQPSWRIILKNLQGRRNWWGYKQREKTLWDFLQVLPPTLERQREVWQCVIDYYWGNGKDIKGKDQKTDLF